MICEIRFLAKGAKYDKKLATHNRECKSLEESLRYAAAVLAKSTPEEQLVVTAVRIRIVVGGSNG